MAAKGAIGGCVGVALWLLPAAAWAAMSIGEIVSPAAWRDAILDRFAIEQIEIGRLDLEIVASPGASRGPFRASSLIGPLARLLDPELAPEIELAEVLIRRTGDPGGWDGEQLLK